jgi:hypothetical protein
MPIYRKRLLLFFVLVTSLMFPDKSKAQCLLGTTGLVTIPTARTQMDGTLSAGISYFDRKHLEYFQGSKNVAMVWVNLTFLPFLELSIRVNKPLNLDRKYTIDRTPMLRLRVLNEKRFLPAIAIGIYDIPSTTVWNTVYFNATFLVLSKKINEFDLHFGYAPRIIKARLYQLDGLFGGVSYTLNKSICFLAEYNTNTVNAGVQFQFLKHFGLNLATINFDSFAAGVNCKIVL